MAPRVLCVSGDQRVLDRIRACLHDAVPAAELDGVAPEDVGDVATYSVVIVTDVDVSSLTDTVAEIHTAAPGLPILVAARNGTEELASDVLVAGAVGYVPLDDDDRLRDRLERSLDQDGDIDRFFDHLVEHVGVGVGAYGRDGIITYANPAFANLLGRSPTALRGRRIWDVNPDLEVDQFDHYFQSFEQGETRHADTQHLRADGSTRPVHTVTTRVDLRGTPLHVGTIMDISERVETQRKIEALHDVANELATPDTVEAVQEIVIDAAERFLDLDSCYYIDHRTDHFYVSAYSDDVHLDMKRIPENYGVIGETYNTGTEMLIEDAQRHPIAEPSSEKFRSAVSIPVGHHGVFQAVSAEPGSFTKEDLELADLLMTHAAAALDRVQFETAIRTERDKLSALFQNVPNPAIEYEIRGENRTIATDVNPAFEAVFGYEVTDFIGRDIDEAIVPPSSIERARSFNTDLMQGRNITAEVKRVTANGTRDFLLDVVPLTIDEENAGGYAIYTDITDQKQRERQLERQNERLEEFASVVSHDLRNPLNVATGRLELAAEQADERTATHVFHAREALERMDGLIADLLTLAREGRSLGETSRIDLASVAREAWESVDTKNADLEFGDAPTVDADEQRVLQLFENLFRNAIEHGGSNVTVTVHRIPGGFAVSDTGPGIPEKDQGRIFTSGFTTSDEGTGFGLSIVEQIAVAHNWFLDIEASDADGARFTFQIPPE